MKQQLLKTGIAWLALGAFLMVTRPDKLPLLGLIVPFVLLYLAFYHSWNLADRVRIQYLSTKNSTSKVRKRLGTVVSLILVLLLLLQSLGQLTVRDVITMVAIVVIGYLYFGRNKPTVDTHA